jgi:hypothetical protein
MEQMDNAMQKARAGHLTNIHHMLVYPDKDETAYSNTEIFRIIAKVECSKIFMAPSKISIITSTDLLVTGGICLSECLLMILYFGCTMRESINYAG